MGQTTGSEPGTGPSGGLPVPSVVEKPKMKATSTGSETSESVKPPKKKAGKKAEKPENGELALVAKKEKSNKPLRDREVTSGMKNPLKKGEKVKKESDQSLQEAMEEIRKKAAIDEIQKRVAQRSKSERERAVGPVGERTTDGQPLANPSQGPIVSSSRDSSPSGSGPGTGIGSGSGSGTGTGPGPGPGTGSGPGPGTGSGQGRGTGSGSSMGTGSGGFPGGSPWGSPYGSSFLESKLNDYYSMVWAKIKEEWTLPENFPKGRTDLETIIVVTIERDGKVPKMWYDKRSGNVLYDQMAMRAIKKAIPFDPIPKEFTDNTLEIGFRFHPD